MKKFFIFCLSVIFSLSLMAQKKAAVLEFVAGTGINQQEVEGLSNIFTTYFSPDGYTLVERNQINKVIEDLGFQKSSLTEREYLRIGQVLNLTAMVLGDINVVMGEYNVDVRLVAAGDGKILAKAGAAFKGESYRSNMQELATELSKKLESVSSQLKTPEPEFVDLGLPSGTLWAKENIKEDGRTFFKEYKPAVGAVPTYANWRELSEMCNWEWNEANHEYIVRGKNGNSIRLPAVGDADGYHIGYRLYYLTCTKCDSESYSNKRLKAMVANGNSGVHYIEQYCDSKGGCLRLVK